MAEMPAPKVVVVDGSNLATEGRTTPSLRQLDEAVQAYAAEDPDVEIVVVVDASFEHRIDPSERPQLIEAELHGEVVSPPAGAIGRGDAFVLRIAERTGARVLSNDSFQEFHAEHPWLFDEGRLVGGKPVPGVGWIFTPRIPVRGPKSRQATGKAKRAAAEALTPPVKAAELARAAKKVAARKVTLLPDGSPPKVGDVWPGPDSNGKENGKEEATAAPLGVAGELVEHLADGAHGAVAARGIDKEDAKKAKGRQSKKRKPTHEAAAVPASPTASASSPTASASAEPGDAEAQPTTMKATAKKATTEKATAEKATATKAAATEAAATRAAATKAAAKKAPATKAAAKKAAAKKAPAKKAPAKKATLEAVAGEESPAKQAATTKASAKRAPAKKVAKNVAASTPGENVETPGASRAAGEPAAETAAVENGAVGSSVVDPPAKKAPARRAPAKKAAKQGAAELAAAPSAPAGSKVRKAVRQDEAPPAGGTLARAPAARWRAGAPGTDGDAAPDAAGRERARHDPELLDAIDHAVAEALSPQPLVTAAERSGDERSSKKSKAEAKDGKDAKRRRRRTAEPPPAVNEPLAFITFVASFPLRSEVEGEVVSFTSHGAMVDVDLPEGGILHCYIPLSAMGDPPPTKARRVLARGERRTFVLVGLDPPRRVAELALPGVPEAVGAPI